MRDWVNASVQLQYRIDLFATRMVEGDRRDLSYDKCRQILQRREQAWNDIRWRMKVDFNIPNFAMGPYIRLVGDFLYVFHLSNSGKTSRAARTVLPRIEEGEVAWQTKWEKLKFDVDAQSASVSVSDDLLVLSEGSPQQ